MLEVNRRNEKLFFSKLFLKSLQCQYMEWAKSWVTLHYSNIEKMKLRSLKMGVLAFLSR